MIKIIVYNPLDGDILRCGHCPADMVDLQVQNGEAWLEHEPVDDAQFMVDLATLEIIPIPAIEV